MTLETVASEMQVATLTNQLDTTLSQLQSRVMDILRRVGPQMQEALRKAMFHVAWSPDTLPTSEAVDPLFEYLHHHLQALNVALLPQNFHRVLYEVLFTQNYILKKKFSSPLQLHFSMWQLSLVRNFNIGHSAAASLNSKQPVWRIPNFFDLTIVQTQKHKPCSVLSQSRNQFMSAIAILYG